MRRLIDVTEVDRTFPRTWIVPVILAVVVVCAAIVSASARPAVPDHAATQQADAATLSAEVDARSLH
jgi:hypothetical protein